MSSSPSSSLSLSAAATVAAHPEVSIISYSKPNNDSEEGNRIPAVEAKPFSLKTNNDNDDNKNEDDNDDDDYNGNKHVTNSRLLYADEPINESTHVVNDESVNTTTTTTTTTTNNNNNNNNKSEHYNTQDTSHKSNAVTMPHKVSQATNSSVSETKYNDHNHNNNNNNNNNTNTAQNNSSVKNTNNEPAECKPSYNDFSPLHGVEVKEDVMVMAATEHEPFVSNNDDDNEYNNDECHNRLLHKCEQMLPFSTTCPLAPPPPHDLFLGPTLVFILSLLILVLVCIPFGVPWYRRMQYLIIQDNTTDGKQHVNASTTLFYLHKTTLKEHSTLTDSTRIVIWHPNDYCTPVGRRVWALFSFAICSAVLSLLFVVVSGVCLIQEPRLPRTDAIHRVMHVVAALTIASLTVEASLNFNIFYWSFAACGRGSSYHSQLYEPFVGFGFIVTAWVLSIVTGILSSNGCVIACDARTIDSAINVFVFCSFVVFLFTTVACPIPHWFYKDGSTSLVTDVLLWRHHTKHFDWNITAPPFHQTTWVRSFNCAALVRIYRATESISIIAIVCNCCTFVCAMLLCKNLTGTRVPSLVFSYAGGITTFVQMVLELIIYYHNWCNDKFNYHAHYYVLSVGFALITSAFCISCVASLAMTLVYILTQRYFPAKKPMKTARQILIEEYR